MLTPYGLSLEGYRLVIVKPDTGVSTAEAYARVTPHKPEISLTEKLTLPVERWCGRS
ncbi:MAG: hypothetical protein ACLR8Y_21775 [Alistipes indistinctus]